MAEEKCDYSRDFKKHLMELTAQWKNMLKRNKKILLKCPNYSKCEYKCSSIGGMQYHYPRCAGACPVFKCDLCGREYESRTGLNYHTSSHHAGIEREGGVVSEPAPSNKGRGRPRIHKEIEFVNTGERTPPDSLPLSGETAASPKKKRGRKPGRPPVNKSAPPPSPLEGTPPDGDPVTLEGITKSPGGSSKRITITIPSIEYPEEYRSYLPIWRDALKNNQSVSCPNFFQCHFQCTTVNGMKYHFIRCQKDKLPEFQCSLCTRSFHCRSGLVWHLKNTHKLSDLPTNQKTIQIQMPNDKLETMGKSKRGRKKKVIPAPLNPIKPVSARKNSRKNKFPRRTVEFILKKLIPPKQTSISTAWTGSQPAPPTLQTPPTRTQIKPTEYSITEQVPTDDIKYGSLVVDYPEEILTQWHKWYSDTSEDEEEDDEEFEMNGTPLSITANDDGVTTIQYVSEQSSPSHSSANSSSSSSSSSDEDYNERDGYSRGRGRGGRGRGRGRKKARDALERPLPPQAPPPLTPDVPKHAERPPGAIKPVTPVSPAKKEGEPRPPTTTPPKKATSSGGKTSKIKPAPRLISGGDGRQYLQLYQVQSLPPSLVPVQLIGGSHYQLSAGSGSLMLVPTHATSSSPQRVSVIMNPHQVVMTTADPATPPSSAASSSSSTTFLHHGHIAQLDGPSGRRGRKRKKETLDREFEEMRKRSNEEDHAPNEAATTEEPSPPVKKKPQKRSRGSNSNPPKKRKVEEKEEVANGDEAPPTTPPPSGPITCPKCSNIFSTKSAFDTHNATTHLPLSPEATIAERSPLWRRIIKKYKYVHCDRCLSYKAKSTYAMTYHYERCGQTEKQVFTCIECDKEYSSKQGLDYHIKAFHSEDVELGVYAKATPTSTAMLPQRTAASKAVNKLQKMSGTQEGETVDVGTLMPDSEEVSYDLKSLKESFKTGNSVDCPKGCGQSYKSFLGLKYHLENGHNLKKLYYCPFCKYVGTGKKRISTHLEKKHDKVVENEEDLEYVAPPPNKEGEEDEEGGGGGGGEGDEEVWEEEKRKKKPMPSYKVKHFGTTSYKKMVEIMKERNKTSEGLYSDCMPLIDNFELVPESESINYLPVETKSMRYRHDDKEASSQLSIFESRSEERLMYVGGPVWSMDWLPCGEDGDCKYVAMATYRTYGEVHVSDDILVHKGLIQLWKFEQLDNSNNSVPEMSFCFGLAHNWGCVREMKWCPSVGIEDTPTLDGDLPRLGILALACSDGTVKILSIPTPDGLKKSLSPANDSSLLIVLPNRVSTILRPSSKMSSTNNFGQALCICWSAHSDKMAAGFSNGTIAMWGLKSPLPFLQSSDPIDEPGGPVLYPIIHLSGHNGPVRCIAWSQYDSSFLFSGGADRKCLLWDVRQPQVPIQKTERTGIITKAVWPMVWPCIVIVEDVSGNKQHLHVLSFSPSGTSCTTLSKSNGPVSSLGYSAKADKIIFGSYLGCVSYIMMLPSCYNPLTKTRSRPARHLLQSALEPVTAEGDSGGSEGKRNKRIVYGTNTVSELVRTHRVVFKTEANIQEEEYYSNMVPLTAVTMCLWCPSSYLWGICAFNNGFVKLVRSQKS